MDTRNLVFIFEYYQRESELRKKTPHNSFIGEQDVAISSVSYFVSASHRTDFRFDGQGD